MKDKELNEIGHWLNTKGFDLDLDDCFWMEDWIGSETTFRDIAELLSEYKTEQLAIPLVVFSEAEVCEHPLKHIVYCPPEGLYYCNKCEKYVSQT